MLRSSAWYRRYVYTSVSSDQGPVHIDPATDYLDEHRAVSALPNVAKDALGGERQLGLAAVGGQHHFAVKRRVHRSRQERVHQAGYCIFSQLRQQPLTCTTEPDARLRHLSPLSPGTAALLRAAATAAALFALNGADARELRGHVVAVADGDTLTVLDSERVQHKVRLAAIDAPERGQPFSDASKRNLSALAFRREVVVDWHKRDRYGRLLGVVRLQLSAADVGLAQVAAGMAWHYMAYASEQSSADRRLYDEAEQEARLSRSGLWSVPSPVPPWEHRRSKRDGLKDSSQPPAQP